MKNRIFAIAFISLILMAIALNKKADRSAASLLVSRVLRAYNVSEAPDALASIFAEATKLSYPPDDPTSKLPRRFERRVTVALSGPAFRREKRDAQGVAQQIVISDGHVAYCSEMVDGKPTRPVSRVEDWQFPGIKFDVLTFGIIPLIKQLQDSSAEVAYLGSDEGGQEKLSIRMASGIWILHVNQLHLIRRVEMVHNEHSLTIEYDDYRTVAGVQLPFCQRVVAQERVIYKLVFIEYDLSPTLPSGYFDVR
jgi:hypothetical protein